MSATRVALASKNPGKVREIQSILGDEVEVVPPDPSWVPPEEDAPDYQGNALLKARSLAELMDVPCLADDSGIEVAALGGAPGPRSARFAGEGASDEENLRKLIQVVAQLPEDGRDARYRCVAVLIDAEGYGITAEAIVEGVLITEPRGSGGFGYDPIFVLVEENRTMAELTPGEKDAISHRGKAFRALLPTLRALGGPTTG